MELVVAVDSQWAIGKEGELLFSIPEDLKRFKAITLGKTIVYGRKTLATFPGGKPLPGRRNLVLTRNPELLPEGCCMAELESLPDECVVVGGAEVYRQLLERCRIAHVTKIDADGEGDSFFPNLDENPLWQLEWQSDWQSYNGLRYCFCKYVKE